MRKSKDLKDGKRVKEHENIARIRIRRTGIRLESTRRKLIITIRI